MGRAPARGAGSLPGLAAADEVLLRPAAPPAGVGGPLRPLPRAVPRAALDRAGPAPAHEPAGRGAVLRRLERDRPGGPPGVARPAGAAAGAEGPPGQGAGPHGHWNAFARRDAAPHDRPAPAPVVPGPQ